MYDHIKANNNSDKNFDKIQLPPALDTKLTNSKVNLCLCLYTSLCLSLPSRFPCFYPMLYFCSLVYFWTDSSTFVT